MNDSGMPLPGQHAVPVEVAAAIGRFYVYVLVDPRDQQIFYVGKGTGSRMTTHGRYADIAPTEGGSHKIRRIREIREAGFQPRIDVVAHGIATADEAFRIEAPLIACLPNLTNIVAGHGDNVTRTTLDDLISTYGAPDLQRDVTEPALLIRLANRWTPTHQEMEPGAFRQGTGWRPQITERELYDSTRGWWKLSTRSVETRRVGHAVAVVDGITRAAYRIDRWNPARADGRLAFSGERLTDGTVFDDYVGPLGKKAPFAAHSQNPITYWPSSNRQSPAAGLNVTRFLGHGVL